MQYEVDNICYEVELQKKKIKNLYIRYKDGKIYINVPFSISKYDIYKLLDDNINALRRMIKHDNKKIENTFLGENIDIVSISNLKYPEVVNGKLYIKDKNKIDDAMKQLAQPIFQDRLNYIYNLFEESIPFPTLKIRKMTSRWGVCNRRNISITLNLDLIKLNPIYLDYVIVHELCHFVHFNHSKSFWDTVSKYCPSYKLLRKSLRE